MRELSTTEAANLLGVEKSISEQDLKKAWRKLAAKNHPDLFPENEDVFKQLSLAYETLLATHQGMKLASEIEGSILDNEFNNWIKTLDPETQQRIQDELEEIQTNEK